MSLGIALGAAAKSGLDTYERLAEEKRRKATAQREEEKYQREEAIRTEAARVPAPGEFTEVKVGLEDRNTGAIEHHSIPAKLAPGYAKAWDDYHVIQDGIDRRNGELARIGPQRPDQELAPDAIKAGERVVSGKQRSMTTMEPGGAIQTDAGYARELAGRIRPYDVQQSMGLLAQAGQFETQALSQGQLKRQARYDQRKEDYLWLQNTLPAAEADEKIRKNWLKKAAELATMAEDNGAAGWKVNIDGSTEPPTVIAHNPIMGQKSYTAMPLKDIVTNLGKYLTPDTAQYQEQRTDRKAERGEDNDFRNRQLAATEKNAAEMRRLQQLQIEMTDRHYKAMERGLPPNQISLLNNKEGKRLRDDLATAHVALEEAVKSEDKTRITLARLAYAGASRNLGAHIGRVDLDFDKEIFGKQSIDPVTAAKMKIIENDPSLSADEKNERLDALMKGNPYDNVGGDIPPKPKDVKVPAAIERRAPVQGTSQDANAAGAAANVEREREEAKERAILQNALNANSAAITEALRRGDKKEADKLARDRDELVKKFKLPTQGR